MKIIGQINMFGLFLIFNVKVNKSSRRIHDTSQFTAKGFSDLNHPVFNRFSAKTQI